MGFTADAAGIGEMLAADFMVDEMKRRAYLVADRALELAPVSDEPGEDHYVNHFRVEAGVRDHPSRRAYGRVVNDDPKAIDIEYGTGDDGHRPQGGSSPRFRVLGRALDAAG